VDVQFKSVVLGGIAPYSYGWSFGDGTPNVTVADPTHSYADYRVYHVELGDSDTVGNLARTPLNFSLLSPPCAISVDNEISTPQSLLWGVGLVAVLASGLGFGLYRWRRSREP
jgi:PKD repeat protein